MVIKTIMMRTIILIIGFLFSIVSFSQDNGNSAVLSTQSLVMDKSDNPQNVEIKIEKVKANNNTTTLKSQSIVMDRKESYDTDKKIEVMLVDKSNLSSKNDNLKQVEIYVDKPFTEPSNSVINAEKANR